MNIAITLPISLWEKIVSGDKTIELRKNFPRNFEVKTDRIYVVLKGTEMVVGFFQVSCFEPCHITTLYDFKPYLRQVCVPERWVINYVGYSSWVYLWHIRNFFEYEFPIERVFFWQKPTNPQSYFYLRNNENPIHFNC